MEVKPEEAEKAIRLLDYLIQLAMIRTTLIRDVAAYRKVLWLSNIPRERGCFTLAWGAQQEYDQDVWIEVQNQMEPKRPALPIQCRDWVDLETLEEAPNRPSLLQKIYKQKLNPNWHEGSNEPEELIYAIHLEDYPEVQKAWDKYVDESWVPWLEEHNKWKRLHEIYSELFAFYQEQIRLGEEYELILGLGLLTWQTSSGQIVRRHLLVANAMLEFECASARFIVRPHSEGSKLRVELDMLDIEDKPPHLEKAAKVALENSDDDPWNKGIVEGVLKSLVHSIGSQGEYDETLETNRFRASARPVVEFAPALILRARSAKGLVETLKRIKEQIEVDGKIPDGFADLAEIRNKTVLEADEEGESAPSSSFTGEVFFPKPYNDEQRRIVEKIHAADGVLVQGPPGTGKSHTIANLICHLLATEKRILITAKTPRALQVLQGLLPESLRSLCISLLGNGAEERRSLESSVQGILRKNEEWDENRAARERATLVGQLRVLREEQAKITRRLRCIRESETHSHVVAEGAHCGTAARIAEKINSERAEYGWFEDQAALENGAPVTSEVLQGILESLRQTTHEDRRELSLSWPGALPSPDEFIDLVGAEKIASAEMEEAVRGANEDLARTFLKCNPADLERLVDELSEFRDSIRKIRARPHSWVEASLKDELGGSGELWRELFQVTSNIVESIEGLAESIEGIRVDVPSGVGLRTLRDDLAILIDHLEAGGRIGWGIFRPKAVRDRVYLLKSVGIEGRRISTLDHMKIVRNALHVQFEIERAWSVWEGKEERVNGPYRMQLVALRSLCSLLESVFELSELVDRCRETISRCQCFAEPKWLDEAHIEEWIASCRFACISAKFRCASEKLASLEISIQRGNAMESAHPITNELLAAIRSRDEGRFTHCWQKVAELNSRAHRLHMLSENLAALRQHLPKLTRSLVATYEEAHWDTKLQNIERAWRWAQARYWVEDYISKDDLPALMRRARQIEDEIGRTIAKLASIEAWSACFKRLKEEHRRHMQAWQQSMQKLGKGTGKNALRIRREAQEHLNGCRDAVPAWVMPLHRIWETVSPSPGMFDVIIVDEASQCGAEALPLLYLGKKLLIVGDDKQISPEAVGLSLESVNALMDEYLHDFEFKSSFGIESSFFDHGKLRYGTRRITLREHFRCMPEIIGFSNDLCYSDTPLIPLRQYGPNRLPPLEHVFVGGGYREGSDSRVINRPEAEAIVQRIAQMCNDNRYDGKSMGVVVLQGEAQAQLIESQLLERLGAEEMERRRLTCGNPYNFQGDERDIIFLSLVAANNERIGPLTKATDERRFNVAASRARDMMILFHSVTCDDLSPTCLRRRLLEYFEGCRPQEIAGISRDDLERRAALDDRILVKPPEPFESWFEVDVALELLRKGYRVYPQYEVANRRIDLVVEGGMARLAVECDGEHWHGADRYEEDMLRQRMLERCGWEFFRVRESAFYANRVRAMDRLWHLLAERKILPCKPASSPKAPDDDLLDHTSSHASPPELAIEGEGARVDHRVLPVSTRVPSRHPEEVSGPEIQDTIVTVLSRQPNVSCKLDNLTSLVLKELGIVTRGAPRIDFEKRVKRALQTLQKKELIEIYKAKNQRVRLLSRK